MKWLGQRYVQSINLTSLAPVRLVPVLFPVVQPAGSPVLSQQLG